ncbi:MAG: sugar transferase, partial [Rubrobacter sp.]|nr:sugar transferase [Rubrobacter sp.]
MVWTRMLDQEFLWWHGILLGILGVSWVVSLAESKILNNRLRKSLLDDLPMILGRVLLTSMVTALGISLVWLDLDHDGLVLIAAALGAVTLSTTRGLAYLLLTRYRRSSAKQKVLVIGAGDIGTRVARLLSRSYQPSIEVVGFLDKEPLARIQGEDEAGLPILGSSYDLQEVIQRYGVDQAIIAFSRAPHQQVLEMVWECDRYGVDVSIVPRFFEATTVQSVVEDVSGVPLLHLNRVRLMGFNALLKRAFDVAATTAGLLVIWPVLLAVALAIKLDSPGPVIFSQKRIGVDGQQFTLYKFRSMRADAETADTWTKRQDPRRTRVGWVIRPLNIDELPQLFNVLKGDMSLVGPRPEQLSYVKLFEESVYRYTHRHRVKSGITGWAQV